MRPGPAAFALALAACKTAAPVHPRAHEHNDNCVRYLEQGNLERARQTCELALEFNPDYPEPYNNLCLLEIRRTQYDAAKKHCIKALRLYQDFAEAHNNLGYIYLKEKSYGKARDEFLAAIKINPDYVAARYNTVLVLMKLKKYDEARRQLIRLIESHPEIADPHLQLCAMNIEEDNLKEAIPECETAIRLAPNFAEAHFTLGTALLNSGRFCEAAGAFKECLSNDGDNAECRTNLAQANRRCALIDPSLRELKDQSSSEETAVALLKLARQQLDKGLNTDAERTLKKCTRAEPPAGDCFCLLARISHDEARPEDESRYCKMCVKLSSVDHVTEEKRACEKVLGAQGDF